MYFVFRALLAGMIALIISWTTTAIVGPNEDLIAATERDDVATIQALLAKGADVDTKDEYGITALMRASQHGHLKSVNLLLAKGSDVNATDKIGWTALMHATVDGCEGRCCGSE